VFIQPGEVKVIAKAAGKIHMYGVSLLFTGGKTMEVYHAVRRFAVQGIHPEYPGLVIRFEAELGFFFGHILFKSYRGSRNGW
jgi:hypothetical protein